MEIEQIRKTIYSRIDELPTLPAVVPKLLSTLNDSSSNAEDVTDVISRDPALTSKILKVANSAYYGFPQAISDLERAIALLGFNMVKSLALSIGVIRALPSDTKTSNFSWEGLWIHSLSVATLVSEVNKSFGTGQDRDDLFIIGLLHDTGKVVLNQFFDELYEKVLQEVGELEGMQIHNAEKNVIGFDHGEVGSMLLNRWKFPAVISQPIELHHKSDIPEGAYANEIAMLRIADTLSQEQGFGDVGNPEPPPFHKADLEQLNLDEDGLNNLRDFLEKAKEGIEAFFNAMS